MAGENEKVKLSLCGKCEQRPWLVLQMPVARQAKHETCVKGMAMALYPDLACWPPTPSWPTERSVAGFFPRVRVVGPESRYQRSSLWSTRHRIHTYRPVPRTRTEYHTKTSQTSHWLIMSSCIDPVGCACPFPGSSLGLREAV